MLTCGVLFPVAFVNLVEATLAPHYRCGPCALFVEELIIAHKIKYLLIGLDINM
jgi:hypothetical protein